MFRKFIEFSYALWFFPIFALTTFLVGVLGVLLSYASQEAGRYWSLKVWGGLVLSAAFIRIKTEGLEHLPPKRGGAIIYANHQAYTDIPALALASPRPVAFVAKKDLLKLPFLGWQIARMHYPIDRGDLKETQALIQKGVEDLKRGHLLAIFPEGTRNKTDKTLLPFKKGAFVLAQESGVPLIPLAIAGTENIWPRCRWFPRWGTLTLTFGPALFPQPEESLAALTKRARSALLTMRGGLKLDQE